jgi:hypothetical protein
MTDHRKDIPSWAFINAQIAQEAVHSGDLGRSVRSVEENYGLPPESFKFINPAYMVSLLYCLIVVPKEIWPLSENHSTYGEIDKDWLLGLFKVELSDDRLARYPVYYLIHHLRNAVAHANFAIEDNGNFTFWDQKHKSSAPYFRASMSVDNLQVFLSKIGAHLANLRTRSKG